MNDWRVRRAHGDARVTVLVVESAQLTPFTSPGACHLVASLTPEAVVVSREDGLFAWEPDGSPISMTALGRRFEGVRQAIGAALG